MEGGDGKEMRQLRYSQIIDATLIGIGPVSKVEEDLEYAAEVTARAVTSLRQYERTVDFHHMAEQDKMRAMLTLNTIYALQSKLTQAHTTKEKERAMLSQQRQGQLSQLYGGLPAGSNSSPRAGAAAFGASNLGGGGPGSPAGGGNRTNINASRVSNSSPGRSFY